MGMMRQALQGLGTGLAEVGKEWNQSVLLEARQTRLAELSNQFQTQRDVRQEGFAVDRENRVEGRAVEREIRQDTRADARQGAGFQHSEALAAAQRVWQGEQNAEQRKLTREQIASNQSIAASNKQISLQIAKLGGSVQPDKDGNVFFVDREGNAKPIMDPNNPDQPLRSYKDLTPAAKAYADVLKAQLVALDKKEFPGQQDDARRVQLNTDLLNVLTGGIGRAGASGDATGGASPYPDGTRLQGKDGKTYVVRGGVPVSEGAAASGSRPPLDSFFGGGPQPGRTGWDSASKQVFLNGQAIGVANTEEDARALVKKGPVAGTPPSGTVVGGFKFKGGNPNDRSNWVSESGGQAEASADIPKLVVNPQRGPSPKERHAVARGRLVQENLEAYGRRVADGFRGILQTGRYFPEDKWVIEEALKVSALSPQERSMAEKMLEAFDVRRGYDRAKK